MRLREGKYGKFYGCSSYPHCKATRKYSEQVERPESIEPRKDIAWSKFQLAIFQWAEDMVLKCYRHLVIRAGAGCGKTTVGVEFAARLPSSLTVAFIAYNVKIARTFAKKLPAHVHASTCHSLGFGNACNALGLNRDNVDGRKVHNIVKAMTDRMPFEDAELVDQSLSSIVQLVSLSKNTLMEPTDENLDYMVDRWNIEVNGDRDLIFKTAREAYRESIEDLTTIDFDDMIFLSATGRVPCRQFDVVVVDETQDLNKSMLEFACRSITPDGHIIAVGDENQSIYGFRGADADAMPNIIARLDAEVLPLSITYRVPKSGVALANTLVPELEAAPDAEEGIVETVSEYQFMRQAASGDLVLCRTNAPLVAPCFDLIRQGKKAVILGRDIGKGLMVMVRKIQKRHKVRSLLDTLEALEDYRAAEVAKFMRAKRAMKAQILNDKIETILALSDGCNTVVDLERRIEKVFSDEEAGITFSTVHKAKGGEADNVWILEPGLMPHPKASAGWEMDQEKNIMYVAWTRHKKALRFVSDGGYMPPLTVPGDEETKPEPEPTTPDKTDLEWKNEFAAREAEQERAAHQAKAELPSLQDILNKHQIDTLRNGRSSVLELFPTEGKFEDNIYRPSAGDFVAAMPEWTPTVDAGQLVMEREIAPGHTVKVYTTVMVGQIAQGTGEDSIRVVREDEGRGGRKFYFKNEQDWLTRTVPQDITDPAEATAHLVNRVNAQVALFTRNCPECGKPQVKCNAGKGRDARYWWKGCDGCRCRIEDGW
jgi:DNA helicase-2/ATP-dependent DNA helicase PcrA